jgi:hypothetical protein
MFSTTRNAAITGLVVLLLCGCWVIFNAPAGVPYWGVLGKMLGVAAGTGLAVLLLGAILLFRSESDRWLQATRSAVLVSAILAIGISARAGGQLMGSRQMSVDLLVDAPQFGHGATVLRANLRHAEVITPDRPHHPDEIFPPERIRSFKRRRTFAVNTGPNGLRGDGYARQKTGPRILCVGDSITFGWGVTENESYPEQLSHMLGVEVINAGMPAAPPLYNARWLRAHGPELDPDIVVLGWRAHWIDQDTIDEFKSAVEIARMAVPRAKLLIAMPPHSTFDPLLVYTKPDDAQVVSRMLNGLDVLDLTPAFRAQQHTTGVVMDIEGGMQRMLRLPERELIAKGKGVGEHLAPEIIDALESDPSLIEPLFFDGGHPDAPGYRLFAEEVARFLLTQEWVSAQ